MEKAVQLGDSRLVYDSATGLPLRWEKEGDAYSVFLFSKPFITIELNGFSAANDAEQMTAVRNVMSKGARSEWIHDEVLSVSEREIRLVIRTKVDDHWELTTSYLYSGDDSLAIDIDVKTNDSRPSVLRAARLSFGGFAYRRLDEWELLMPGYIPELAAPIDLHRKLDGWDDRTVFGSRRKDEPGNGTSLMGVYHPESETAMLSWWMSDRFPAVSTMTLVKEEEQLRRESVVYCPCELGQGESISIGTLHLSRMKGSRLDALRKAADSFRIYERLDMQMLVGQETLKICELHIGEKMGRKTFDDYDQIAKKLPYLKNLGFNAIQVMPSFPFPSYSVYDYFNLDKTYGSERGLKDLVRTAKRMGLKVILDMVLHGPLEQEPASWRMAPGQYRFDSPYLTDRTGWFSRHESGDYARTYTRAFDLANPELRRHISEAIAYYAGSVGIDGVRLDAQTWNFFPNWRPEGGRQPYESIYAGLRMMEDIRKEVKRHYPDLIFYTEGIGPLAAKCHDYRYNYDFHWIYPALSPVQDERGMSMMFWNPASENTLSWDDLAQWLEEQRTTVPRGLAIVHQTDSHDSHEWAAFWQGQFHREAFGPLMHRVHAALALFMDGGFMSFYGAELGHEAFYAKLLPLKDLPLFSQGRCSYTDARTNDPKVFCVTWTKGSEWAVVLGNLEEREKEVEIVFCPESDISLKARETEPQLLDLAGNGELSGAAEDGRIGLFMAPCGVLVLSNAIN